MKKLIGAVLASGLLAASLVAPAGAAAKKRQTVEGSILFPAVFAQSAVGGAPFDGCWAGLTRRLTQSAGMTANGVFGYRFPVDKATWKKPFKLAPTGGEGTVDLDIYMYSVMPPAEAVADDPVNGGTPVSIDFTNRKEGGEAGFVPKGTTDAIVCMYGGDAYYGYNATFKYVAGKGVPKPKK